MAKKTTKKEVAKSAKKARRGRPTTLTVKIKSQLEILWRLSGENVLSDAQICEYVGITHDQLKAWLQRNEELRHLRTRARASVKVGYLQKLHQLIDKAEAAEDFATAAKYVTWLLEKMFPRDFGSITQMQIEGGPKIIKMPFTLPENFAFQRDTG